MLGAIAGDVIGSVYEFANTEDFDFPLFGPRSTYTDDTVLTVAVADCLLNGLPYAETIRRYAGAHPGRGYGGMFAQWIRTPGAGPYRSFGNGSAMRVSPVGFARSEYRAVWDEAKRSAEVTHDHPEGVKGAQAVALAIFLARTGHDKPSIKDELEATFMYDLSRRLEDIRPTYRFNETCQGSVPEAIIAFLESKDFEDCIRKAVWLGGDVDTTACMAGGIAQAFYKGVPAHIEVEVRKRLHPDLLAVADAFGAKFGV
jgi:ADP-ribosylglycohydrolase